MDYMIKGHIQNSNVVIRREHDRANGFYPDVVEGVERVHGALVDGNDRGISYGLRLLRVVHVRDLRDQRRLPTALHPRHTHAHGTPAQPPSLRTHIQFECGGNAGCGRGSRGAYGFAGDGHVDDDLSVAGEAAPRARVVNAALQEGLGEDLRAACAAGREEHEEEDGEDGGERGARRSHGGCRRRRSVARSGGVRSGLRILQLLVEKKKQLRRFGFGNERTGG